MPYEQKDMSGSAFRNEDKDGTERTKGWADLKGKAMVNGEMFYVDVYKNKSQKGETYLSFKFKPIEQQQGQRPQRRQQPQEEW